MDINSSFHLGLEQILKALIPHLQGLTDEAGFWDFLDVFPAADPDADPPVAAFLIQAGHAAEDLPNETSDFLAFISGLPKWKGVNQRLAIMNCRLELATGGIADAATRPAAIASHSARVGAVLQLFSTPYWLILRAVLNDAAAPWNAGPLKIVFTGWSPAGDFKDGKAPGNNNYFIAEPAYNFTVNLAASP